LRLIIPDWIYRCYAGGARHDTITAEGQAGGEFLYEGLKKEKVRKAISGGGERKPRYWKCFLSFLVCDSRCCAWVWSICLLYGLWEDENIGKTITPRNSSTVRCATRRIFMIRFLCDSSHNKGVLHIGMERCRSSAVKRCYFLMCNDMCKLHIVYKLNTIPYSCSIQLYKITTSCQAFNKTYFLII
jgi:hypothetical protein